MLVEPINEADRSAVAARLAKVQAYGEPRNVWVDDGHVFVEGHDGTTVSMTPAVAIHMSKALGKAGADSLINKIMDEAEERKAATARDVIPRAA